VPGGYELREWASYDIVDFDPQKSDIVLEKTGFRLSPE
jgi:hypothetical protein